MYEENKQKAEMKTTGEKVVPSGAYNLAGLGKKDSEWGEGMGWGQISKSFVSSFSIYFSKGAWTLF